MVSVNPSQDLNLNLLPTTSLLTPKLEPKPEPYDPYFPTPDPKTPQIQPDTTSTANVYSEYDRISEAFRTAFASKQSPHPDPDSRALVAVPPDQSVAVPAPPSESNHKKRSSELVRVTDFGATERRYFRDLIRKTRMIYEALRVYADEEDEKRRRLGLGKLCGRGARARSDLKSASVMKERGLWQNRDKRIVGSIPGVQIGDLFVYRMELCVVGLHGTPQSGIDFLPANCSSNKEPIATSIVVSGGYEDDEDGGDVIIYTGQGGQDKNARQCGHQKLEGGNLALERSMYYGLEVRVIRGRRHEGSPSGKVYVYDGLYKIIESWFDVGKSGFGVYKYKLVRMDNQPEMGSAILRFAENLRNDPLSVRPVGYISLDISMKKESVPVLLYNDIDSEHEPVYYEYIATTVFPPFVYHGGACSGCDCVSICGDDCLCAWKNGGGFAYDRNGILMRGKPLIYECGINCRCPPECRNRVSQKGVKNRFEVFRSRETGWGVRSLDLITAGTFICEFAGVVLTREQAELFTMNGDSLVYPNRFASRWTEWGNLSDIFSDYVHPSFPSIPPLEFAMDVSRMRNVACYISHSSSPNVLVQFVLYDHNNMMFPHLMLFAMENIPPLRELSIDYGVADEWNGKLRICN
ncbi:hypothetical protein RHMOL_Rhmol02G0051300 [Rhododendron molle]|uniref:Uncharacterized protein n=1 Tax=Rhododendron molle TaxID=49168 RepID=A0ACC0PM28_RHOML|nr:hypothetical protein RHMOL_Rhmol02G0051300 [Rhododendron molle]